MDPITIAMGLAQFVPQLTRWITGSDKATDVAQKAIDIANQVTGQTSGDASLKALQADPNLVLQYRKAVLDQEVAFEQLAVQNASDINKTMQTEATAEHWPTYGWRPFIGFVFGLNLLIAGLTTSAVYVAVICGAASAVQALATLPQMIGALGALNGTALPILGIASWFRGKMQADPNIPTSNRG
jgi:hypothetical protein